MVDTIKNAAGRYLTLKIVFLTLSLFFSIPLITAMYWSFDSSYLAAFGVGPELFNRPIFSSKLINTWLVVVLYKPGFWLIVALAVFLLIVLSFIFYHQAKSKSEKPVLLEPKPEAEPEVERHAVTEVFVAADKALISSLAFLWVGLFLLLAPLLLIIYLSSQATILADKQINAYIEKGECIDTFNGSHIGCYAIPKESCKDNLIIFNDNRKLIYLSVDNAFQSDGKTIKKIFHLNLTDKVTGEKITRLFKKKI
jgi:hypothetical protein